MRTPTSTQEAIATFWMLCACPLLIWLLSRFFADTYVLRTTDGTGLDSTLLSLGGRCEECCKDVCVDSACSIFYTKRYCATCAAKHKSDFPRRIQAVSLAAQETPTMTPASHQIKYMLVVLYLFAYLGRFRSSCNQQARTGASGLALTPTADHTDRFAFLAHTPTHTHSLT